MALACIDCSADLPSRDGRGRRKLRCERCRVAVRKAYERAYVRGIVPPRTCVGCGSGTPAFRRSYCMNCAEQRARRVTYTRKCWCSVEFVTHNPLKKYCTRACSPWGVSQHARKTADRGYGTAHQRRRDELLPAAIGTDCSLCGDPMNATDALDADHVIPISQGGVDGPLRIVHASCNRRRPLDGSGEPTPSAERAGSAV